MWQAEVRVDLDAIRAQRDPPPVGHQRRADGGGEGRRVRPRHAPVRAGRARRGGATGSACAPSTRRSTLRRAGITAPVLAWLLAPGLPLHEGVAAEVDLAAASLSQLDEMVAAGRRRRPAGPAAPEDRHRPGPRRGHRRRLAGPAGGRREGPGRRPGRGGRRVEPLRVRGLARPPHHRPAAGGLPRRAGHGRAGRPAPALPAPGQLGGHADPTGHPLRPGPARDRRLRAVAGRRPARSGCARR